MSPDGIEFLSYARQIVEQAELMEQRYTNKKPSKQLCSVSTQHYAFAVNAFVNLISSLSAEEYEFTLRETRTYEIIDDVANFRSEVGILYFSHFNEKILKKMLTEKHLSFIPYLKQNRMSLSVLLIPYPLFGSLTGRFIRISFLGV